MKEESPNPEIDPKLEARIVALVLGEASDFEQDELTRLMENRPELVALKRQIQNVHGLLISSSTDESIPDDEDWKLPEERRSVVLSAIQGESDTQVASRVVSESIVNRKSFRTSVFIKVASVAAALCLAVCISGVAILPFMRHAQMAQNAFDKSATLEGYEDFKVGNELARSAVSGVADKIKKNRSGGTPVVTGGARLKYKSDSKSALSSLRGTLGDIAASTDVERTNGRRQSFQASGENDSSFHWGVEVRPDVPAPTTAPQEATLPRLAGVEIEGESQEEPVPSSLILGKRPRAATKSEPTSSDFAGAKVDSLRTQLAQPAIPDSGRFEDEMLDDDVDQLFDSVEVPRRDEFVGNGAEAGARFGSMDGGLGGGLGAGGRGFAAGGSDGKMSAADGESPFGVELNKGIESRDYSEGREFDQLSEQASPKVVDFDSDGFADRWQEDPFSHNVELKDAEVNNNSDPPSSPALSNEPVESESLEWNRKLAYPAQQVAEDDYALPGPGRGDPPQQDTNYYDSQSYSRSPKGAAIIVQSEKELSQEQAEESFELRVGQDLEQESVGFFLYAEPQNASMAADKTRAMRGIKDQVKSSLERISELNELVEQNESDLVFGGVSSGVDESASRQLGQEIEAKSRPEPSASVGRNVWHDYVPPAVRYRNSTQGLKAAKKKRLAGTGVPAGLNEKNTTDEAFSTFSLHVSDVSFKLAWAALSRGEWPEAAKIRIEEFVNAFDYGDPMPSQSEKVSCRLEQSIHPFLQQRNLLRVSMRTAAAGRSSNTPLRLTLLLDNSGSMERTDRQQTVRRAFSLLTQQLKPIDRVTLISFARQPRLLADNVSGAEAKQLVQRIQNLPSEGGTNIEAALQLAFEKAKEHQLADAQNRVILLTDGAVNLGDAKPDSLSRRIVEMRNAGIAFDAAGISADGLNDEVLEALTRQGDGRYYLLDFPEAADSGFARQIAGALRPAAKNVKVQVEFNPKRVGRYKLLGFEKHRLKKEDFRNDKVDAAEMAAAEAGVAVYQFEAKPDGEGDIGSVSVRFLDLSSGQMVENRWPIPYEADAPRVDQAAPSLRLATTAALLAAKLRGEPLGESVDLRTLSNLVAGLPDRNVRIEQLQQMIQQARQMSGK